MFPVDPKNPHLSEGLYNEDDILDDGAPRPGRAKSIDNETPFQAFARKIVGSGVRALAAFAKGIAEGYYDVEEKPGDGTYIQIENALEQIAISLRKERHTRTTLACIAEGVTDEVAPAGQVTYRVRPQCYYRVEGIIATGDLTGWEMVASKVGKNSQDAASGSVPLAHVVGVQIAWDTAHPGMTLEIVLCNTSNKPLPAPRITLIGTLST
jgi:hypothetical protein